MRSDRHIFFLPVLGMEKYAPRDGVMILKTSCLDSVHSVSVNVYAVRIQVLAAFLKTGLFEYM